MPRCLRIGSALLLLIVVGCDRTQKREDLAPQRTGGEAALAWLAETLRSEDGTIRRDGLRRAREHRRLQLSAGADRTESAGLGSWTSRGPSNFGGRTREILIHPTQPDTMWAAAVSGGVWKTTDAGASWFPLDDFMGNLAVVTLAMDPGDPDTIYAGTGEGFASGAAEPRGDGIFKTTDGGATWTQLASTVGWRKVHRVVASSNGSVYAAVSDTRGVYRSTNGGTTWNRVLSTVDAWDLEIDPNDPDRIAFSGARFEGILGLVTSVWVTSNAGTNWIRAGGITPVFGSGIRMELAWAPSVPGRLFVNDLFNGGVLWRSDDGGANFFQVASGLPFSWINYYNTLWVHPTNADILLTGEVDVHRSVDGGVSWTKVSDWRSDDSSHADIHWVEPHPGFDGVTNRTVFVASDGGIARADDVEAVSETSGWTRLQNDYRTTQFYGADGLGWNGRVYGGTQDQGSLYAPQSTTEFIEPYGGDGGVSRFDVEDESYCYGEYVYLQLHRSSDGCQTATEIWNGIPEAGFGGNANFIAPFEIDPTDPRFLYAGGVSLWRTDDARAEPEPTWTEIRGPGSAPLSAVTVAAFDPGQVWVGQNDGGVAKTLDARGVAPTWQTIDDNGAADPLPDRYVTRILIDRDDPNRLYIGLGGYEPDNLWTSDDGGASWSPLAGSGPTALPPAPVRGIERHPCRPDWLYVGTDVGVYASEDGGASWSTSNEGPADVSVHELRFMAESGRLLAATYGRGLWEITATSGTPDLDADGLDDACDPDDDGDRVPDLDDCAPADPAFSAIPLESSAVTMSQAGSTSLSWDAAPDADRWDVVGGTLAALRTDGGVLAVDCLADDRPTADWTDPRPDPAAGDGYYYLVRAQNPCGSGPLGDASDGTPRTPAGICP